MKTCKSCLFETMWLNWEGFFFFKLSRSRGISLVLVKDFRQNLINNIIVFWSYFKVGLWEWGRCHSSYYDVTPTEAPSASFSPPGAHGRMQIRTYTQI